MIVTRITVVVLECAAIGQAQLAEQSGVNQQPQGAVNGRAAHVVPGVMQVANELVSIEVLVGIKNMADQHPPGFGQFVTSYLEELAEFLDRRVGNCHGCHGIALHFRPDSGSLDRRSVRPPDFACNG